MVKPVIYGFSGTSLSEEEKEFFKSEEPFGFIIFSRNLENPEQLKVLTAELHSLTEHDIEILVDQEGGRVQRLTEPHWQKHPPVAEYKNEEEAYEGAYQIARELAETGITVNCAPMLDVRAKDADDIIGDRAFGEDAKTVSKMGAAFMNGQYAGGIKPVIKHIPGHGRATCDSHEALPKVCATLEELQEDFLPFKEATSAPYAMTAHIIYEAIDPDNCATQSKKVIDLIRNDIGFAGMIMTDDLSMKALEGSYAERTKRSLDAGCDLILHCNGKMEEMLEISKAL